MLWILAHHDVWSPAGKWRRLRSGRWTSNWFWRGAVQPAEVYRLVRIGWIGQITVLILRRDAGKIQVRPI
jgi:hypothetical protein